MFHFFYVLLFLLQALVYVIEAEVIVILVIPSSRVLHFYCFILLLLRCTIYRYLRAAIGEFYTVTLAEATLYAIICHWSCSFHL